MSITIEIPDLTGAECGDIAITAAEGGIGYWSEIVRYDYERWSPESGENIEVDEDFVFYQLIYENPTGPGRGSANSQEFFPSVINITPKLLREGFELALKAPLDRGGWMANGLLRIPREDWTGEIDSSGADLIVQFGIFGEVVFG